jgi:lipoprotein-releasing system ATP-binding protein
VRVDLDRLGHRFGVTEPWLFRDLSTRLSAGTVTAVVGPSGTGKSTLLSILAGTIQPAEGRISFDVARSTARVSQSAHGVPGRAVIDHITLPFLARGSSRADAEVRASDIAEAFGLRGLVDRPYQQLSGGEAQRLMLARAVAMNANLILADEPTASLDASSATGVISVLQQLAGGGATVIVATHDSRARGVCDATIDLTSHGETRS